MIRTLGTADVDAWLTLRRLSLRESPLAFSSSPETDMPAEFVTASLQRGAEWMLFGAFAAAGGAVGSRTVDGDAGGTPAGQPAGTPAFHGELAGAVGLFRDRHAKSAHRAHVWGMYVLASHRGQGLGTALLDACVAHARSLSGVSSVQLSVTSAAPAARKLYERAGFRVWGTLPDAFRHEGHAVEEHHMALALSSTS
jgi:RimJ/RimL family protein N-acetyltransferase